MDKVKEMFTVEEVSRWMGWDKVWTTHLLNHTRGQPASNKCIYRLGPRDRVPAQSHIRIDSEDADSIRYDLGLSELEDIVPDSPAHKLRDLAKYIKFSHAWIYRSEVSSPIIGYYTEDDPPTILLTDAREWFGRRHFEDLPTGRYLTRDLASLTTLDIEDLNEYAHKRYGEALKELWPTVATTVRILEYLESCKETPMGDLEKQQIANA